MRKRRFPHRYVHCCPVPRYCAIEIRLQPRPVQYPMQVLNPRLSDQSADTDEQYEGCLDSSTCGDSAATVGRRGRAQVVAQLAGIGRATAKGPP
jgi:peptide deformylase